MALSRRSGGRSRLTIALLVLTSIALLTLDFRNAEIVQSARRVAGTVFSPLRGAAETVGSPFSNAWHGVTDYGDIKDENDDLRKQLDEARGDAVLEEDSASQLAEILEQENLEWVGNIETTTARVLSSDPSNFSHTVDLSKGSDDGLKVGMPVVNGAGLAGRLVQVTPHRATVQLITDPDFLVGVRVLGSDLATGTARGQGAGEDLLVDTRLEPDIDDPPKPGTALTTSGAQLSAFPDSIPVGKVRTVRETDSGLTYELVVRPMADTERMQFATVLLWEPPP
ncbi:MAG: rod shape-determining protein MreC [Acidimicrobiales bacterium]